MNLHSPCGQPCLEKETENPSSSQQEIPQDDTQIWYQGDQTVEEALTLDKENGNDLWWKEIQKEMSAVKVAFKILDDDERQPIGSQYMKCHMVFSIKMEDFPRKACLVAGGHMVEAPKELDICKCGFKRISQNCPNFWLH